MVTIVPNPKNIRGFRSTQAFEAWLSANHDRREELWLRIYKKASGMPTVTYAEALDVALCWGWIDGIRKGLDDTSFLQRFTPRRAKSIWSQNNREHVARLIACWAKPRRVVAREAVPSASATRGPRYSQVSVNALATGGIAFK